MVEECKRIDPELRRPAGATHPEHTAACIRSEHADLEELEAGARRDRAAR
jgi:hypothetical protein